MLFLLPPSIVDFLLSIVDFLSSSWKLQVSAIPQIGLVGSQVVVMASELEGFVDVAPLEVMPVDVSLVADVPCLFPPYGLHLMLPL